MDLTAASNTYNVSEKIYLNKQKRSMSAPKKLYDRKDVLNSKKICCDN